MAEKNVLPVNLKAVQRDEKGLDYDIVAQVKTANGSVLQEEILNPKKRKAPKKGGAKKKSK